MTGAEGFSCSTLTPPDVNARLTRCGAATPPAEPADGDGPVALVIGSSAGYGLAATVVGLARHRVSGVAVALERSADNRRTATAGWYRTARIGELARQAGSAMSFVNADAFADTTKEHVLDLIKRRFGKLDVLVYSVAAPRRLDPRTGETLRSVVKPIGASYRTKHLSFDDDGAPKLSELEVAPASPDETLATVRVMGGEDWACWVRMVSERGLTHPGFRTVALSYVGSDLTAAIYRQGTIGAAKDDLEATAQSLTSELAQHDAGYAMVSVNGATITQSSLAIPGVALYLGLLRSVLGSRLMTPVEQCVQLWDHLLGSQSLPVDEQQRLRLDTWELAPGVQSEIRHRWQLVDQENLAGLTDAGWVLDEVRRLYGFSVPAIDYEQPVEIDVPWPAG